MRNPSSLSTLKAQFDVFFDIAIRDKAAGRMVFQVSEDHLPKAVENFKTLVTGERGALDSTLNYKNCAFEFSSMYTMGAQYKWSHVCKGRGKNVFGNGKDAIKEPEAMAACRHPCPGSAGSYYGINVDSIESESSSEEQVLQLQLQKPLGLILEEDEGVEGVTVVDVNEDGSAGKDKRIMAGDQIIKVGDQDVSAASLQEIMDLIINAKSTINLQVRRDAGAPDQQADGNLLAVPVGGPGCGFSRFDIIRMRASPQQWQERILVNSAVLGFMLSGSRTLNAMASGAGEPVIVDCGIL